MSSADDTAWELTRRLSPRDQVTVMRRDAYGDLAGNSYPGRHYVRGQAPSVPWAMYLANVAGMFRMLCFDFDGKKGGEPDPDLMEAAADDADALSRILDRHQVAHVLCESSETGGRHIWIHVPAGVDADLARRLGTAARALYGTLDHGMLANPRQGAARPPLSPHRDGSRSRILRGTPEVLLHSTVTAELMARVCDELLTACPPLAAETAKSRDPQAIGRRPHRALSKAGESYMATLRGGENPSLTGFQCLLSAVHAGWSFADVEHAAKTAPGMEHYRTKNTGRGGERRPRDPREAATRLLRQWEKAQAIAATHVALPRSPAPTDVVDVDQLSRELDALEGFLQYVRASSGRWARSEGSQSDRSVLTALAYLTVATGKPAVAASIRTVALLTGLGRSTVSEALRRLMQAGLVSQEATTDGAGNAAEWRLPSHFSTSHEQVRSQPFKNPRPPNVSEIFVRRRVLFMSLEKELQEMRHDVFSRNGLGHLAGRAYALLKSRAAESWQDVARLLGASLNRSGRALSRLLSHRLIRRQSGGQWVAVRSDRRHIVAATIGVVGVLHRREKRYAAEREVWTWWLAELDTMHSSPRRRPRRQHATSRPLFSIVPASSGERAWPRYPRDNEGMAEHRAARTLIEAGVVRTEARWQYLGDVA